MTMLRAKRPTSYFYGGMRFVWENAGDVREVPDKLGFYLSARRDGLFEIVEPEGGELPGPPVGDPPPPEPRTAAPELGRTTADGGGIAKGADGGDAEDEG